MQYEQNTRDIRSLVKNYTIVPGLVLAAIGGFAVFLGAFNMLWDKWLYWVVVGSNQASWLVDLLVWGSLILPLALYFIVLYRVNRYYKSHFGQVKPRAEEIRMLTVELVGAGVAYFVIGQWFDIHLHSPVSITMLIFALFLLVHWWLFARTQRHYPLLAVIAMILSVVPLFSRTVYFWLYIKYTSPDWYGFNLAICVGILLLIAGLLDHWYLVRMFAHVRSQVLANSPYGSDVTEGETGMEEL